MKRKRKAISESEKRGEYGCNKSTFKKMRVLGKIYNT